MKWIEFTICLVLDVLLLTYLIVSIAIDMPAVPGLAKVIFAAMCILALAGTRITYNEARGGQLNERRKDRGRPDDGW